MSSNEPLVTWPVDAGKFALRYDLSEPNSVASVTVFRESTIRPLKIRPWNGVEDIPIRQSQQAIWSKGRCLGEQSFSWPSAAWNSSQARIRNFISAAATWSSPIRRLQRVKHQARYPRASPWDVVVRVAFDPAKEPINDAPHMPGPIHAEPASLSGNSRPVRMGSG